MRYFSSMRTALVIILLLLSNLMSAEIIKIGLFHHQNVKSVTATVLTGSYQVHKNDQLVHTLHAGEKISVSYSGGAIILNSTSFNSTASTKMELIAVESICQLSVTPKSRSLKRKIVGHLSFWNRGKRMSIINTQDLDVYISGVIEAEAGSKQNEEYYKVQAVICRTYALSNKFKHAKNGFHLCDEVHCQVYKGISESNPDIIKATIATSDVVVVDQDVNLITTAFHSNCGGQTINSEDVWSEAVPYLKAVTDTFCLDMPHSQWNKSVKRVNWMGFMQKKNVSSHPDSLKKLTSSDRKTHFQNTLHIKDIRSKFRLQSTLFSLKENGDEFEISGRGFGHGVGLCQEGAMKMSQLGYDYMSILHFYFTNIHIVPLSNFHLFQDN